MFLFVLFFKCFPFPLGACERLHHLIDLPSNHFGYRILNYLQPESFSWPFLNRVWNMGLNLWPQSKIRYHTFWCNTWKLGLSNIVIYLISVNYRNLVCFNHWQLYISSRFNQSLTMGFIPINTQQQRASLSFKLCVLERKVHNNDDITFFSVITFSKPLCDNVLQRSQLRGSGCNTLSHSRLIYGKECFILLLTHDA